MDDQFLVFGVFADGDGGDVLHGGFSIDFEVVGAFAHCIYVLVRDHQQTVLAEAVVVVLFELAGIEYALVRFHDLPDLQRVFIKALGIVSRNFCENFEWLKLLHLLI